MFTFKDKKLKFVEKYFIFVAISLAIILAGLIVLLCAGAKLGVEFSGGATIEVTIHDDINNESEFFEHDITSWLENSESDSGAKLYAFKVSGKPRVSGSAVKTYEYQILKNGYDKDGNEVNLDEAAVLSTVSTELKADLEDYISEKIKADNSQVEDFEVSDIEINIHTIGNEVMMHTIRNAFLAVGVAVVVILIYIALRFTLISGVAAIIALVHDVLIMTACMIMFRINITSTYIAAVITIIGYSINATIVIFDKVRELERKPSYVGKTDAEVANDAVSSTLSRSILTTLTTLVMISVLAIFGSSTIRDFALPIIFGLFAGAYSSVLLSSSTWVYLRKLFKVSNKRPTVKGKLQKQSISAEDEQ